MTTAREWRRRHQLRAPALAAALVALAVHLDPAAVLFMTAGEAAALEALAAAWQRARARFGERVPSAWRFWNLISRAAADPRTGRATLRSCMNVSPFSFSLVHVGCEEIPKVKFE